MSFSTHLGAQSAAAVRTTRAKHERWRLPSGALFVLVYVIALALRLAVAVYSHGSNDIDAWQGFAELVRKNGVLRAYELEPLFNHPPLMGYYATGVERLVTALHCRFDLTFKLLPILANMVTILLVQRLAKLTPWWLLLFALNPADVLISSYHGNTDAICVALSVGSLFAAERGRPFWSGALLGAAVNVKLIPVIFIAPLAASLAPRTIWRFALGLAVGALPFVPAMLGPWAAFRQNAISYNSFDAPWGIGLIDSALDGRLQSWGAKLHFWSYQYGKLLILGFGGLIALIQALFKVFRRGELFTIAVSAFLLFAPGFGVQYLIFLTPFFAILPKSRGFFVVLATGATAYLVYYHFWTGTWPAYSSFDSPWDQRSVLVGFLVWIALARYIASTVFRIGSVLRSAAAPLARLRIAR